MYTPYGKVDGSTPKRWLRIRGHDKPRLMGVAIAIDPFRVVYGMLTFGPSSIFTEESIIQALSASKEAIVIFRELGDQAGKFHQIDQG